MRMEAEWRPARNSVRGLAAYGDLLPGGIANGNDRRGGIGGIEERSFDCVAGVFAESANTEEETGALRSE